MPTALVFGSSTRTTGRDKSQGAWGAADELPGIGGTVAHWHHGTAQNRSRFRDRLCHRREARWPRHFDSRDKIGDDILRTEDRGRIQDADFAAETANLTRSQILQQAGTAMLAQANSAPQNVLSLLRG